jgi:Domain of unknown function (DUF4167)
MALNSFTQQHTMDPEAVQPRFLNDDNREGFSGPRARFPPELREARQQRSDIPGGRGNPVAAENYLQHAEHYFRLIATAQAMQLKAQNGDVRAAGYSGPEDLENDDESDGLPDRFASSGQQERQALTGQTNVVAPVARQPYGQRQPWVRRS